MIRSFPQTYRKRAYLLATGQSTSYGSGTGMDDGALKKGIVKAYTVLTSGAYSGTKNVDMVHYTSGAGAVTFNNTLHTIVDTGNGLATFKTNDVILTNSANNPGPFTVTTGNVAGTITCTGATFVNETPAGAVAISKREALSNACVEDNNTGLMWQRTPSAKMGPLSNGTMAWTTDANGVGIFAFLAAVNAASLAGYSDWRIPNVISLLNLMDGEAPTGNPDSTAFPTCPSSIWSSTTDPSATANALRVIAASGVSNSAVKTTSTYGLFLVRG